MPYETAINHENSPKTLDKSSAPVETEETSLAKPPFMNLFGPLQKNYCIWFYFLSMIGFILVVLILVFGIYMGIMKRKGMDYYAILLTSSLAYVIFYFQNRLLYGMCSKSL